MESTVVEKSSSAAASSAGAGAPSSSAVAEPRKNWRPLQPHFVASDSDSSDSSSKDDASTDTSPPVQGRCIGGDFTDEEVQRICTSDKPGLERRMAILKTQLEIKVKAELERQCTGGNVQARAKAEVARAGQRLRVAKAEVARARRQNDVVARARTEEARAEAARAEEQTLWQRAEEARAEAAQQASVFGTMDDEVVEDYVHVDEARVHMLCKQCQYDKRLYEHCGGISSDPSTPPFSSLSQTPAWSDRDRRIELDSVSYHLHVALCKMQRRRFEACVAWCERLYLWERRSAFGGMHDVWLRL